VSPIAAGAAVPRNAGDGPNKPASRPADQARGMVEVLGKSIENWHDR